MTFDSLNSGTLTAEDMRRAWKLVQENALPTEPCPKCGKACYVFKAHPEAAADLEAIGYDGSCCFDFLGDQEES